MDAVFNMFRLDIDTASSDDTEINLTFDLSDILTAPEDFANVEVRFYAAYPDGGEKAEVDLVSLRLAALVGDVTSVDPAASFESVNAAQVWANGNTGVGVGIAVLDTGVKKYKELERDSIDNRTGLDEGWDALKNKKKGQNDKNGHGTLVASVASNSNQNAQGKYYGVAPDSTIIPIQVLDETVISLVS